MAALSGRSTPLVQDPSRYVVTLTTRRGDNGGTSVSPSAMVIGTMRSCSLSRVPRARAINKTERAPYEYPAMYPANDPSF